MSSRLTRAARWTGFFLLFAAAGNAFGQSVRYTHDVSGNLTQISAATTAAAPTIVRRPVPVVVAPNDSASFSVVVSSASPVTYQWKRNGQPISGATGDTYLISAATAASEGNYTVVVTNATGSVTSAIVPLYLDANGNGLPDTWEQTYFGNLTQTASGDFDKDGVSNLDEFLESTNPNSNISLRPRLTVQASGGVVNVTPLSRSYAYGQSVTLKAVPAAGYGFFGWQGDLSGFINPASLVLNGSKTVVPNFNAHGIIGWGYNYDGETVPPVSLSQVVALASGDYHSLALRSDGTVVGWGYNGNGQTSVPAGVSNVVAIAAGERHSLALRADGTVIGWGYNNSGQTSIPATLSANAVAIAANASYSLALRNDGTVVGWGNNSYGQLNPPAGLNTAVAIAAGERHGLALLANGSVVAWGYNNDGETTVPAEAQSGVVAIAAGDYFSVALKGNGSVVAWGYNADGQTNVPGEAQSGVVAIAAGDYHSLALRTDGSVVAWGYNNSGQTVVPAGLPKASAVSASRGYSLALASLEPGTAVPVVISPALALADVGDSFHYRIFARNRPSSFKATGLPPGLSLNASTGVISGTPTARGSFAVTLSALNTAGTSAPRTLALTVNQALPVITSPATASGVVANGFNYQVTASNVPTSYHAAGLPTGLSIDPATGLITGAPLQLGIFTVTLSATNKYGTGTQTLTLETKTVVGWGNNVDGETTSPSGLSNVTALAAGDYHSLALRSDGTVVGWGYDGNGQTDIPAGLGNVVAIAAGERHSLALRANGTVVGWGYNNNGQTSVPATVTTNVAAIAANASHSLALRNDGTVVGWGNNSYGQLNVPDGLDTAVAIAAGERHGLALRSDGAVVGWGNNDDYQSAIPVSAQSGVIAIAAGDYHSLALKADGSVVAWGYNDDGETNVPAEAQSGVVAIAAGNYHSLALKEDGSVVAWGYNNNGQTSVPAGVNSISAIAGGNAFSLALASLEPGTAVPVVISPALALADVGDSFHYRIFARNRPSSFKATGLPPGLSLNASTGVISGTPTAKGSFAVTLTAVNAAGSSAARTLALTVNQALPVITSPASANGKVGTAFSYQIAATHSPTKYGATGLAAGLKVNTSTGLISGTPSKAGTFKFTITATNSVGTGTSILTATINSATNSVVPPSQTLAGSPSAAHSDRVGRTASLPSSSGVNPVSPGVPVRTIAVPLTTVSVTATTPRATTTGTAGEFTLTLPEALTRDLQVNYAITGSAVNGIDYRSLTGTQVIRAGRTSVAIKVTPRGDLDGSPKKTVKLVLQPGDDYTVGTTKPVKVGIFFGE